MMNKSAEQKGDKKTVHEVNSVTVIKKCIILVSLH